jgi:hypothetical protein
MEPRHLRYMVTQVLLNGESWTQFATTPSMLSRRQCERLPRFGNTL